MEYPPLFSLASRASISFDAARGLLGRWEVTIFLVALIFSFLSLRRQYHTPAAHTQHSTKAPSTIPVMPRAEGVSTGAEEEAEELAPPGGKIAPKPGVGEGEEVREGEGVKLGVGEGVCVGVVEKVGSRVKVEVEVPVAVAEGETKGDRVEDAVMEEEAVEVTEVVEVGVGLGDTEPVEVPLSVCSCVA